MSVMARVWDPAAYSAAALPKNTASSSRSRSGPGVAITVLPDRDASSGVANTPQGTTTARGTATMQMYRSGAGTVAHAQTPKQTRATSSSTNLMPRAHGRKPNPDDIRAVPSVAALP